MKQASAGGWGSCFDAHRTPMRMGRSYTGPSFFSSPGARLTVMRRWGNSKPQFLTAARTRSRDSFTEASGRPTTSKCGRPPLRSHWHSTGCPWMPTIPQEWILATMRFPSAHRLVRRLRRRFFYLIQYSKQWFRLQPAAYAAPFAAPYQNFSSSSTKQSLFFSQIFAESGLHSPTFLIKYHWFIRSKPLQI